MTILKCRGSWIRLIDRTRSFTGNCDKLFSTLKYQTSLSYLKSPINYYIFFTIYFLTLIGFILYRFFFNFFNFDLNFDKFVISVVNNIILVNIWKPLHSQVRHATCTMLRLRVRRWRGVACDLFNGLRRPGYICISSSSCYRAVHYNDYFNMISTKTNSTTISINNCLKYKKEQFLMTIKFII